MKRTIGMALTTLLLTSPAAAAPPEHLQGGFVCNSLEATNVFHLSWTFRGKDTIRQTAKLISTPQHWCIEGEVDPLRPSIEMHREDFTVEIFAAKILAQIVPGAVARTWALELLDTMTPHVQSYKTLRGVTMYFTVLPPEPVRKSFGGSKHRGHSYRSSKMRFVSRGKNFRSSFRPSFPKGRSTRSGAGN
ncbi:MAG: hypothetical protein WA021_02170 [Minisyncoccia bacterium]